MQVQPKQPDPLIEARELFRREQYEQSKAKLQSVKQSNQHIDLNLFLAEHKINPGNSDIVLKALMDRLTQINIRLYKENMGLINKNNQSHSNRTSNKNPIKHISHEFYYWNIIIIAQQIGKPSIASLMGNEALHFSSCFRTKTALMIIYEQLKQMACENRLASCGSLVMKFKEIFEHAKHFTKEEEIYRAMNHIMWTKIFLRLGFLQESQQMYKQKLSKAEEDLFNSNNSSLSVMPFEIYRQFLHAEVQYFKQNYKGSLQILGDILNNFEKNERVEKSARQKIINMVESNVGAIFMNMGKTNVGRKLALKANEYFRKVCHQGIDNQRFLVYERSKQLLFYSFLKSPQQQLTKQDYTRAFHLMARTQSNKSYKLFYRKGQLSVRYLHHLIRSSQDTLPYKAITDQFDCSYFYINEPYFQSKGKNKNPLYNQGKKYYRRYIVEQWDDKGSDQRKYQNSTDASQESNGLKLNESSNFDHDLSASDLKEKNNGKSQQLSVNDEKPEKKKRKASNILTQQTAKDKKNPNNNSSSANDEEDIKKQTKSQSKQNQTNKVSGNTKKQQEIGEIAFQAITFFKQSLSLLEQENKVILTFKNETTDLTQRVNLKIYEEYRVFKQSILMNLCYLYLCRQNWTKVIQHAEMYRRFVAYDKESNSFETQNIKKAYNHQEYFCVMSYELEAYCQINKFAKAYETLQDIIQLGYSQTVSFDACSSINSNPQQCFIEETNQYHNLLYNITILHMRDNHLPQAHQALQKILSETNILPNRSSFKTPLSVNDLLLHYHLRTGDRISALEILKRRRVMGMGGVNGVYNVLKVTK